MSNPVCHLQKAEISLACWYSDAQWWLDMAKQFVFASRECKQLSLRCKTEGLVWHDRYKMILDCNRKLESAYKTIRRAN